VIPLVVNSVLELKFEKAQLRQYTFSPLFSIWGPFFSVSLHMVHVTAENT